MPPAIDIVIPSGPGERAWRDLLPCLDEATTTRLVLVLAEGDVCEIEHPPTNLQVLYCEAGRARQLNAGARASRAGWLWFLHADSRLQADALGAMHRFVAANESAIGYFRLRFLDDGPRWTFLNAWGADFRSRVLGLPFGDQGLLMPRRVFEWLGGFDEGLDAGEDHALIWTARGLGIPLRMQPAPIYTSARKYAEFGWWRTTLRHWRMTRAQARTFSRRQDCGGPARER